MQKEEISEIEQENKQREGKYLTFVLLEEEYGLEIQKIREITVLMEITTVPKTPDFIKGVVNLRGKVIPVIDLRLKFGMPSADYTKENCIIVMNLASLHIGIIVDSVSEVLFIKEIEIEPPPSFGKSIDASFIFGLGKVKAKAIILLDIDKVLSSEELGLVTETEDLKDRI